MQTGQVIWIIVGVAAAMALFFLIRLFRMPQDDRLSFPSMDEKQRPTDAFRIRSKKDAIAFLQRETGDQELALFLFEVAETIGRDGYIDVRQGGSGNPYAVEYDHRIEEEQAADQRSSGEIRAELDRLKQALKRATSDDEREQLERQIGRLAGGICTIWINVTPPADYERLRNLIKESFRKLSSAAG